MNDRLRGILITFLVVVWAANLTLSGLMTGFKPPPEVHVAFMTVIGILYTSKQRDDPPP